MVTPEPWEPSARGGTGGEIVAPRLVTVITPTLPDRFELLHEAMDSVRRQTFVGVEHSILLDTHADGPARLRNAMLEMASTPFVAFLDDDDLLDPDHIESLYALLEETGASVAYSWPRIVGPRRVTLPRPTTRAATWRLMHSGRNVIPVTVLARRDAILAGGGFRAADRYEDFELWLRLNSLGHRFALLPRETWTYRFLGENRTHT